MNKESIKLAGAFKVELFDKDMKLKESRDVKNTIVTVGKNFLAAWLAAASQAGQFMDYQGLGTGTTGATVGDTDLETPLATRIQGSLSSSGAVLSNEVTFGPGVNTGAITEAGLFSVNVAGTLFARQVFGIKTKDAGDTLTITWEITLS